MKRVTIVFIVISVSISLCGCFGSAFSNGRRVIPQQRDTWLSRTGACGFTACETPTAAYAPPPPRAEPPPPWANQ